MKVIKFSQLPTSLPIRDTALTLLVLDRLKAPRFAWGVAVTLLVIVWVMCIWAIHKDEYHDVAFKDK